MVNLLWVTAVTVGPSACPFSLQWVVGRNLSAYQFRSVVTVTVT